MKTALFLFGVCLLNLALYSAPFAAQTAGGFSEKAAPKVGGGFSGPGPGVSTVEDVLNMRDDSYASLRGKIERHTGGEHYLFRDATGTINVEIDHDKWAGQNVSPDDTVLIHGKLDKGWREIEFDVKQLIKE